jgi:hypothetical protein
MKTQSKASKLILFALILLLSSLLFAGETSAAPGKQTVINDTFNSAALDENAWIKYGDETKVELADYGGALQMYNGLFARACVWMGIGTTAAKAGAGMAGGYTMELVFSLDCNPGDWLGIYVGLSTTDLNFQTIRGGMEGNAGNIITIDNSKFANYSDNGMLVGDIVEKTMKNDGTPYKLKLEFVKEASYAASYADIYLADYNPDEQQPYVKLGTLAGISVDGYFGFGSASSGQVTVSGLKISQDGRTVYEPDLKEDILDFIYGSRPLDAAKQFRIWNSFDGEYKYMFKTGQVSALKIQGGAGENAL